jgi:hypothetical protein
MGHKVR